MACETILFARMLKYTIEAEMRRRRTYFRIEPIEDKRKKSVRIRQELTGLLSNGKMHLKRDQFALIEQLQDYPDVNHDDYIDCLSIGMMGTSPIDLDYIDGEFEEIEDMDALEDWRGCPGL